LTKSLESLECFFLRPFISHLIYYRFLLAFYQFTVIYKEKVCFEQLFFVGVSEKSESATIKDF